MKIYPYMNGSKSAKALAEGLGIKVLLREGKPVKNHLVINWGCSAIDREVGDKILNNPVNVAGAANKLLTFQMFAANDVPTVEWTTNPLEAAKWLDEGFDVVVRKKLSGHSGEGILILEAKNHIKNSVPEAAPLYTKYTKKKDEYRIHVFGGEILFQQRKARKKEVPDDQVNWQVRNLAGGFIFANDQIDAPECVKEASKSAVQALGLDFGAVDVGFREGACVVYEVNTACGLQGKNLEAYVKAFQAAG
jgi:glutathione synthase/RimK-type ligase-like ATP-grasp enzyme